MKIRFLSAICFSFLLSASLYAQEPLSSDLTQQIEKIAAQIKDNPDAAEDGFNELLKGKNKKNASLLAAIGKAYLDNGKTDIAKEYAEDARKADSKNGASYVLNGDIALSVKDVGTACGYYEQAILLLEKTANDSKCQNYIGGVFCAYKHLGDVYYKMVLVLFCYYLGTI